MGKDGSDSVSQTCFRTGNRQKSALLLDTENAITFLFQGTYNNFTTFGCHADANQGPFTTPGFESINKH